MSSLVSIGCPQCERFRQAGLDRCPKCGRTFGGASTPTLVLRDAASGQTWRLTDGRLVVGRADVLAQGPLEPGDVPVPLDDRLVSRRHAIIRVDAGQFSVTDAGSTDGTHVNEQQIIDTTSIADGDRLRFGDTVLVARVERSVPAPEPPPPLADPDRTVFQAPLVTRRAPDAQKLTAAPPPPPTPPDSPTPARPAVPSAPARFTPLPAPASAAPAAVPQPRTSLPAPAAPAPLTPAAGSPPAPASQPPVQPQPVSPAPTPPTLPIEQPAAPIPDIRLSDIMHAAGDLAASTRQLERELSTLVGKFERAGGRTALLAFLTQARRVEANPGSAEDLETLIRWLPSACQMLETELLLLNLLSPQASDAPR